MTSASKKSSAKLEQEVRDSIRKVDRDVDSIQSRLSPGRLIDELIFDRYRGNFKNTLGHIKSHPIGSSLLALGTLMLSRPESDLDNVRAIRQKVTERFRSDRASSAEFDQDSIDQNSFGDPETYGEETLFSENLTELAHSEPEHNSIKDRVSAGVGDHTLGFIALGLGLGILSGRALPESQRESGFIDSHLSGQLTSFGQDLDKAMDEAYRIFTTEFLRKLSA